MLLRQQSAKGISSVCRDEDNRRGVTKAFVRAGKRKFLETKHAEEGRKTLVRRYSVSTGQKGPKSSVWEEPGLESLIGGDAVKTL
jgi:hypothetical protein